MDAITEFEIEAEAIDACYNALKVNFDEATAAKFAILAADPDLSLAEAVEIAKMIYFGWDEQEARERVMQQSDYRDYRDTIADAIGAAVQ